MPSSGRRAFVVGVGMIKFEKPGKRDWDYPQMAKVAANKALRDAGIPYTEIQQAAIGYVYGDSTCGQRALYEVGLTGIPVYNVNNNCSTGSTALYLAKQLVAGGVADCVLALGFEKMERGSLAAKYTDRTNPMDKHMNVMMDTRGVTSAPFAPQMFGNAGREHMDKYGTKAETFGKIALKNHKHSVNNPYSQFRDEYTLEDIMKSRKVFEPLTMLQCCPTSDGAAAVVVCSEDFVKKHNLQHQAVEIVGMSMATDMPSTFNDKSCIKMIGFDMTRKAAQEVYQQSGLNASDVQVIELHDCFASNELITYEALGLCKEGDAGKLVEDGQVSYGGKWVVNPSGGLISKGHPLGATGLAQCSELVWQLRGMAGKRQVPNARVALQHNVGLGGAVVVTMYKLGFPDAFRPYPAGRPNPAVELEDEPSSAPAPATAPAAAAGPTVASIFADLEKKIASDSSLVKAIGGVYQFNVGGKDSWTVDLKNGNGSVKHAAATAPDCTITIAEGDFVALFTGKLDGQKAFMQGKLKISGNMAFATKLGKITQSKAAPAPAQAAASAAASGGDQASVVFEELSKSLAADPSVVKRVNGIYQFNISSNGNTRSWAVDLKNGNGSVKQGPATAPDCTITMKDVDFVALMSGKLDGQTAFMQGKLKVSGNMAFAMKLRELTKAKAKL